MRIWKLKVFHYIGFVQIVKIYITNMCTCFIYFNSHIRCRLNCQYNSYMSHETVQSTSNILILYNYFKLWTFLISTSIKVSFLFWSGKKLLSYEVRGKIWVCNARGQGKNALFTKRSGNFILEILYQPFCPFLRTL